MNNLLLVSVSPVKTETSNRKDGKVSRQYYVASFANPNNPFGKVVSRTFWQQHSADGKEATWKTANPELVKSFIGKLIPGQIVSSQVEEYDITDSLGHTRAASTYTTVVLEGETAKSVFKAAGKIMVETVDSVAAVSDVAVF